MDNKTIIEKPVYMNIDDSKNNWYLDAEKFDVNFPLVCTNRSNRKNGKEINWIRNVDIFCHYNHFNVLAEYFSQNSIFSALIVEVSFPNEFMAGGNTWYNTRVDSEGLIGLASYKEAGCNIFNRVFEFGIQDKLNNNSLSISRYILVAPISDLLVLKSRFMLYSYDHVIEKNSNLSELYERNREDAEDFFYPFENFPFSQLIVTKDWDLVKRYLFFMIRNHQYENAFLRYNLDNNLYCTGRRPIFMHDVLYNNGLIRGFQEVPKDYRFGELIKKEELISTDIAKDLGTKVYYDYETCFFDVDEIIN